MKKFTSFLILSLLLFSLFAFLPKQVFAKTEADCQTGWDAQLKGCETSTNRAACIIQAFDDYQKCIKGIAGSSGTSASPAAGTGGIPLPSVKPSNLPNDIDINGLIKKTFDIIVSVGEVAFIIVLLVGGVMYITSSGDEGAVKARKMMLNAVIGIVVLLSAWALATWVLTQLGANIK